MNTDATEHQKNSRYLHDNDPEKTGRKTKHSKKR